MSAWAEYTRSRREGLLPVMVWLLDEKTLILHNGTSGIVHQRCYIMAKDYDGRPMRVPCVMRVLTDDDRVHELDPYCIVFVQKVEDLILSPGAITHK